MRRTIRLIGSLSPVERRTLRWMAKPGTGAGLAPRHEVRLVDLGLAERVGGELGLTANERRAVALIAGWVH